MRYESDIAPSIFINQTLKKYKLYTKNIFLFFLVARSLTNSKISIFINSSRRKRTVILRAPYRYKLGRIQLLKNNYNITVAIKYLCQNPLNYHPKILSKLPNDISSGITNLKHSKISTQITFLKNFKITSFNIIFVFNIL